MSAEISGGEGGRVEQELMPERIPGHIPGRIIAAQFVGIPILVIGLADYPVVILAGLGALLAWALRGRRDSSWRTIALLAAAFGTTGEAVCVIPAWYANGSGLWEYHFANPFGWRLELPIWLPLVWANLFVLFAAIAQRVPASSADAHPGWRRYAAILVIVAHAFAIARVVRIEILYGLVPLLTAFLIWWTSPRDLVVYWVAALLGSLGEILAMRAGLWVYTAPFFSSTFLASLGIPGIPISLPMAWGLCAVFVRRLAQGRQHRDEPRNSPT